MSEQRFTIQKASGMYLHLPIFDNDVEMADGDVCILLNEQQATIEQLQQSQDVKEFSALFNQSIALQREIKDLKEENKQLHYQIIDLQDKLGMSEKVIDV